MLNKFRSLYWNVWKNFNDTIFINIDGYTAQFEIKTKTEYKRLRNLEEDKEILSRLLDEVQEDDVFYDIGANIGLYSCILGQKIINGQVVAFEPHPMNSGRLKDNAKNNKGNIKIMEVALSDQSGSFQLQKHPNSTATDEIGVGHFTLSGDGTDSRSYQVETLTGDNIVENGEIPCPSVIKIDVEGGENRVIKGIERILDREQCRLVYCEVHTTLGGDGDMIENILNRHNFETEMISINTNSGRYVISGEK